MNNKFFFPSKRSNIDSFKVMQLLSDANKLENLGKKVYHLELGEPPQITPLLLCKQIECLKINQCACLTNPCVFHSRPVQEDKS